MSNLYARRTLVNNIARPVRILGEDEIAILSKYVVDRAKVERQLVTLSIDAIGRPFVTTVAGPSAALKIQADHPGWCVGVYNGKATAEEVTQDIYTHLEQLRSRRNVK